MRAAAVRRTEYFCVNRQETITSTELSKRRCAKYEP